VGVTNHAYVEWENYGSDVGEACQVSTDNMFWKAKPDQNGRKGR